MRKILFLSMFTLIIGFFCGCPVTGPTGDNLLFWGWKSDGSGIVALTLKYVDGYQVVSYDINGNEINRKHLEIHIPTIEGIDQLYFANDGKTLFVQVNDDVYSVNSDDGRESLIVADRKLLAVSPSGTSMLVLKQLSIDTSQYEMLSLDGNKIINSVALKFSNLHTSANTYREPIFVKDSICGMCFADTGLCSFTFFDLQFNKLFSIDSITSYSCFAPFSQDLFYISYGSTNTKTIKAYNLKNKTNREIHTVTGILGAISTSPSSFFLAYNLSSSAYPPYMLIYYNIITGKETSIASDVESSGQISPDAKRIAYFTKDKDNIHFHIIAIP